MGNRRTFLAGLFGVGAASTVKAKPVKAVDVHRMTIKVDVDCQNAITELNKMCDVLEHLNALPIDEIVKQGISRNPEAVARAVADSLQLHSEAAETIKRAVQLR